MTRTDRTPPSPVFRADRLWPFEGGRAGFSRTMFLALAVLSILGGSSLAAGPPAVDKALDESTAEFDVPKREAILRRSAARPVGPRALSLGRCTFDADRGELSCDGEPVRITEAEVTLLRRLARSLHEPVDRLELARDTADATGRAVDVQVTRLRRKIEPDPSFPRYLRTVRGQGYRLVDA